MSSEENLREEYRKGFGDLPDDILIERGEVQSGQLYRPVTPNVSPDIRSAPDMTDKYTGENLPSYGRTVKTVFDARPINAIDFHESLSVYLQSGEVPNPTFVYFTIPIGYTGILRGIRWRANMNNSITSVELYINGISMQFLGANPISPDPLFTPRSPKSFMIDFLPVYYIIPENSVVALQFVGGPVAPDYEEIMVELRGNLIPVTDVPANINPASIA